MRAQANFGEACAYSFGVLSLLYLVIMLMGHRTFGDVTTLQRLKPQTISRPSMPVAHPVLERSRGQPAPPPSWRRCGRT